MVKVIVEINNAAGLSMKVKTANGDIVSVSEGKE